MSWKGEMTSSQRPSGDGTRTVCRAGPLPWKGDLVRTEAAPSVEAKTSREAIVSSGLRMGFRKRRND